MLQFSLGKINWLVVGAGSLFPDHVNKRDKLASISASNMLPEDDQRQARYLGRSPDNRAPRSVRACDILRVRPEGLYSSIHYSRSVIVASKSIRQDGQEASVQVSD